MSVGDLEIRPGLVIPEEEIRESASRSSGPGGQHVNKTNTRVTLRWGLGKSKAVTEAQRARLLHALRSRLTGDAELIVNAEQSRSRSQNRELARARIVALVDRALEVRRKRRPTRPSRAARVRVRDAKSRRGDLKKGRRQVRRDSD
jgi:ribosome-associated protein